MATLIPIADLTGPQGPKGDKGDQGPKGDLADLPASYNPNRQLLGPIVDESVTVNLAAVISGTVYNQQYVVLNNTLPAVWPVDNGDVPWVSQGNMASSRATQVAGLASVATYRVMCDSDKFAFYSGGNFSIEFYVDGRPVAGNPHVPANNNHFITLTFATAKPRLIEWRTVAGIGALYTNKPYRI